MQYSDRHRKRRCSIEARTMTQAEADRKARILSAIEGWRVTVDPITGMVTRGDPRPAAMSPFVRRALARELPAKEYAR